MDTMTIGQLATAAGVHVETVRYYERRGLVPEPGRSESGYRQYTADDLWRLQLIGRAKRLGFTLTEIAELMGDDASVDRILAAAHAKIAEVDGAVAHLGEQRTRLTQLVGVCAEGPSADCTALRLIG